MSIDLILWGATRADIRQFGINRGLISIGLDGLDLNREGFTFSWWRGRGKFAIDDARPPTEAAGFVALVRIFDAFFADDALAEGPEQWQRSKIAKAIQANGTPGTALGSIPYFQWDGVRLFRPADVEAFLAANNAPGHQWLGGNVF